MLKFRTKNTLFGSFWAAVLKNYFIFEASALKFFFVYVYVYFFVFPVNKIQRSYTESYNITML